MQKEYHKNTGPDPEILSYIRKIVDFSDITPINRGYSFDRKFLLKGEGGQKFLLRITPFSDDRLHAARKEQYTCIQHLRQYSSLVPEPYHYSVMENSGTGIMILEYIEGEDLERCLDDLTCQQQYEVGYIAGEELRKIHALPAPPDRKDWYFVRRRKYEWYLGEYQKNPYGPFGLDIGVIEAYVAENMQLMKDVNQTFQHDDYHPGNLIFHNGNLAGIIDFNRCDWGDPIHDFYKIALFTRDISIPFSCGQIDGYYQGDVPDVFWKRYALYGAMSIISDLVWSERYSKQVGNNEEMEKSARRVMTIYQDHYGFSSDIPEWYREWHGKNE